MFHVMNIHFHEVQACHLKNHNRLMYFKWHNRQWEFKRSQQLYILLCLLFCDILLQGLVQTSKLTIYFVSG